MLMTLSLTTADVSMSMPMSMGMRTMSAMSKQICGSG
jgi:hypothetical protein